MRRSAALRARQDAGPEQQRDALPNGGAWRCCTNRATGSAWPPRSAGRALRPARSPPGACLRSAARRRSRRPLRPAKALPLETTSRTPPAEDVTRGAVDEAHSLAEVPISAKSLSKREQERVRAALRELQTRYSTQTELAR